jgi:hypothetical protein
VWQGETGELRRAEHRQILRRADAALVRNDAYGMIGGHFAADYAFREVPDRANVHQSHV